MGGSPAYGFGEVLKTPQLQKLLCYEPFTVVSDLD